MRRMLPAAMMLLTVAGCAQYWARPGGTQAELDAAKDGCETGALKRFPMMVQNGLTVVPGVVAPVTQCTTGPGGNTCITNYGSEFDANGSARAGAFRQCMIAAGWLPTKDKDEAEAISRLHRPLGPPSVPAVREASRWCDTMFNLRRNATIMAVYHGSLDQCVSTRSRDLD
jgi:hypothetical protein